MVLSQKRLLEKNKFSTSWHKRLGHISKEGIPRLIDNRILPLLSLSGFHTCDACFKGKFTKTKSKKYTRSKEHSELIYTNISGLLDHVICDSRCFITFIHDFSRCGYVYLLLKKNLKYLISFKIFNIEVEKQYER